MRILVVEDDEILGDGLCEGLRQDGHTVDWLTDGRVAEQALEADTFDTIVLDLSLPGRSGLDILASWRRSQHLTPVLVLTAREGTRDCIAALDLGADDYVVKPFSPKELEARIRCVLRRVEKDPVAGIPNSGLIQVADLRIDTNKRQVFRGDERIRLTGMEFSLLELLVSRSGEPFNRGEILKEVWGYTPERHVDTRVVDVHISRLRSKLEDDPANPELILTARGTGYLFQRIVDSVASEGP
mgnify:CR=1 FL=1